MGICSAKQNLGGNSNNYSSNSSNSSQNGREKRLSSAEAANIVKVNIEKAKLARRAARGRVVVGEKLDQKDLENYKKVVIKKSKDAKQLIRTSLRSHFMFSSLREDQLNDVADVMKPETVTAGQEIIKQGDSGDKFYIVDSGHFNVIVDGETVMVQGSPLVLKRAQNFGELALMYNCPRNATIKAVKNGKVWTLDRLGFKMYLTQSNQKSDDEIHSFISKTEVLSALSDEETWRVVQSLTRQTLRPNQVIVKEGEIGDVFYLIEEGIVTVKKGGKEVAKLKAGQFFGERALITNEPRDATVTAFGDVTLLALLRSEFEFLKQKIGVNALNDVHERRMAAEKAALEQIRLDVGGEDGKVDEFIVEDMQVMQIIGRGAFGEVKLVKNKKTGEPFAMKVEKQKADGQSDNELAIMLGNRHPFVLGVAAMKVQNGKQYLLMEFLQGGDLFSKMVEYDLFPISTATYYAACVTLAFSHLHGRSIVYRDLKPENCVLTAAGVLKVVDFGMAKKVKHRTYTVCGTPEYMAPELINSKGYQRGVDFWALGILIYEMLCGYTPFHDPNNNHLNIYKKVFKYCKRAEQVYDYDRIVVSFPRNVNDQSSRHIIQRLLCPKPSMRLGCMKRGDADIVEHPWFAKTDFAKLLSGKVKPPISSDVKDPFDTKWFDD